MSLLQIHHISCRLFTITRARNGRALYVMYRYWSTFTETYSLILGEFLLELAWHTYFVTARVIQYSSLLLMPILENCAR